METMTVADSGKPDMSWKLWQILWSDLNQSLFQPFFIQRGFYWPSVYGIHPSMFFGQRSTDGKSADLQPFYRDTPRPEPCLSQ